MLKTVIHEKLLDNVNKCSCSDEFTMDEPYTHDLVMYALLAVLELFMYL